MPPSPQMSGDRSDRDVKVFRELAQRAKHMTILAVLATEPWLVKILAPFKEGLGLLAYHPLPEGVAVGAHGRRVDARVRHRWVRCRDVVGSANLAIGRQMTTGTRQPAQLLLRCASLGLGDSGRLHIRELEGLREMANVACVPFFFDGPRMDGERVNAGDGVQRRRSRDVGWQCEWRTRGRLVDNRLVLQVAPESRGELTINGLMACPTEL